mgnify:CR=1 FL=1
MKYIYTFCKLQRVQYVSHLDTLRVFERAMRRAKLPASYSQGFHPHPLITFAQPLGVGISSEGELVEIAFERPLTKEEQKRFQDSMPEGFAIKAYRENEKKSPFAALAQAVYDIRLNETLSKNQIEHFLDRNEILVMKHSKKGEKQVNIRPMIYGLQSIESEKPILRATLKAGQPSLKPELLLQAMEQDIPDLRVQCNSITRIGLLDEKGNPMV